MARTVKCYICKKDLNKEDAYMFTYTSQSGKEYRKYCFCRRAVPGGWCIPCCSVRQRCGHSPHPPDTA